MEVIMGETVGRQALIKAVGRGSSGQVEFLDALMSLLIHSVDGS